MANDNKPNPNKLKISPWILYAGIVVLFLFISFATGGSSFQELAKTTSSKFNTYLANGEIQKVIVYNKAEAEVYLTPEALKLASHKAVAKDLLNRPNTKGPHYVFDIGNDEIFQKKLETAVAEGKLKDYNFLPKSNWSEIFINLLPILIIVAIWIFIMRRMSSGGPGGGGQIFNIGKSKAKFLMKKQISKQLSKTLLD
jgi:cell division protease FtsH